MSWEFDDKHPKELAFIGRRPIIIKDCGFSRRPLRRFGEPIQLLHLRPFFIGGGVTFPHEAWFQVTARNHRSRAESHWGLNLPAIRGIKGDCYLAAVIFPMAN